MTSIHSNVFLSKEGTKCVYYTIFINGFTGWLTRILRINMRLESSANLTKNCTKRITQQIYRLVMNRKSCAYCCWSYKGETGRSLELEKRNKLVFLEMQTKSKHLKLGACTNEDSIYRRAIAMKSHSTERFKSLFINRSTYVAIISLLS